MTTVVINLLAGACLLTAAPWRGRSTKWWQRPLIVLGLALLALSLWRSLSGQ